MKTNSQADIYQLKVMMLGISPTIWRRILIRRDSTITDLHYILQILMGWEDYYLHQFIIRGKKYGVSREYGVWFDDESDRIFLNDFQFRINEKFIYEYNFISNWRIQIRLEKILPYNDRTPYPVCICSSRQAPFEDCQGPWAFMELRHKYSKWHILNQLFNLIEPNENANDEDGEEITDIEYWLNVDQFDRHLANKRLRNYSLGLNHWDMEATEGEK
ncbi:MAG: plasmid pRiA4b ORF-3 family protein [Proteobacteria bacterium]|nr:plasmid pRiA4b ORF-3 family protein [Pseudomonadota bacterium]